MVARSVLPATSRATFASASSNEEAAPPLRSVASFEKSNRLLNSLPVFPKSKSEMEIRGARRVVRGCEFALVVRALFVRFSRVVRTLLASCSCTLLALSTFNGGLRY